MAKGKGTSRKRLPKYLARHISFFLLGFLVLASIITINQFKLSRYFPIKKVRVYGMAHLEQDQVKDTLLPMVRRGFFSIDVEHVRDRLEKMPWVSDIVVRRNWPDQLDVTVIERQAVALWNHRSLLSAEGELFSPKTSTYPGQLTEFIGPDGKQITMLKYFVKMNRILGSLHAKISYLELTPYYTWKLKLDNGIVLKMGYSDVLTRLSHFVKVYPKIVGSRAADVDYVDLRYSNGMAVRWKKQA